MDNQSPVQKLLDHAFFCGLTPTEAKALFSAGKVQPLAAGRILFEEGDPEDGLFFVLSGVLEVHTKSAHKTIGPLAYITAGEVLGEMGLLNRKARTATIVAETDTLLWHLSKVVFEGLLERGDPLASGLLKGISEDLCRRFRAVVYEGAALMGELAPQGAKRIVKTELEEFTP
jgi:CRP/FNR family transcriptional regulator, cyclic AMP receptor protein